MPTADAGPRGYLALIGGGSEVDPGVRPSWSETAYGWIVERSNHGPVAILAATDQSEWIPDYFRWLGAEDAFNVLIDSADDANDPNVQAQVEAASAVFIKGGDQWRYVDVWTGTGLLGVLHRIFKRGGVLAGTSAGAHVLSEVVFDAREGSLYPEDAIRNARHERATLTDDFLHVLPHVLVDSHVTPRGRQARMAALMARYAADQPQQVPTVLGIDERTALLVERSGMATVVGEGAVTLLQVTAGTVLAALEGQPPVATALRMEVLTDGSTIDVDTHAVSPPGNAAPPVPASQFVAAEAAVLDGSLAETDARGSRQLFGLEEPGALEEGRLSLAPGDALLPGAIVVGRAFQSSDLTENRMGGLLWALAQGQLAYGVLLDDGVSAVVDTEGVMRAQGGAALVIDARQVQASAATPYTPRQASTLVGARLHVISGPYGYSTATGGVGP
jgi:cyanophycinase